MQSDDYWSIDENLTPLLNLIDSYYSANSISQLNLTTLWDKYALKGMSHSWRWESVMVGLVINITDRVINHRVSISDTPPYYINNGGAKSSSCLMVHLIERSSSDFRIYLFENNLPITTSFWVIPDNLTCSPPTKRQIE